MTVASISPAELCASSLPPSSSFVLSCTRVASGTLGWQCQMDVLPAMCRRGRGRGRGKSDPFSWYCVCACVLYLLPLVCVVCVVCVEGGWCVCVLCIVCVCGGGMKLKTHLQCLMITDIFSSCLPACCLILGGISTRQRRPQHEQSTTITRTHKPNREL